MCVCMRACLPLCVVIFACGLTHGVETGCSEVPKVSFANYCEKDVTVEGWNTLVAAGQVIDITESRPPSNRIRWKYADGSTAQWDFIELNNGLDGWTGPGTCFKGHPSYSSYNGYNMASKYEALKPDSGEPACADMGAEVSYTPDECPTGPGNGYLCQGNSDCASEYSKYIRSRSNAINDDGTRTPTAKDTTYGANYVNFWCDEIHGFHEIVSSLMNCVEHSIPFVLRITTCNVNGPPVPHDVSTTGASTIPMLTTSASTTGASTTGAWTAGTTTTNVVSATTTSSPSSSGGIHPELMGGILVAVVLVLAVLGGLAFGMVRQRQVVPDVDHGSGHVALAGQPDGSREELRQG